MTDPSERDDLRSAWLAEQGRITAWRRRLDWLELHTSETDPEAQDERIFLRGCVERGEAICDELDAKLAATRPVAVEPTPREMT